MVFGTAAACLDQLAVFLRERTEHGYLTIFKDATDAVTFDHQLDRLIREKRGTSATTIAIVPAQVPWSMRWVNTAMGRISRLRAEDQVVRVLFIGDAETAWGLRSSPAALAAEGVDWVPLLPWHDEFVRQWLDDVSLPSRQETRKRIAGVTGNWANELLQLRERMRHQSRMEQCLDELERELLEPEQLRRRWPDFGLHIPEPRETLRAVSDFADADGEVPEDDAEVAQLLDVPAERLRHTLCWAELLGLALRTAPQRLRLDPVVRRLLRG